MNHRTSAFIVLLGLVLPPTASAQKPASKEKPELAIGAYSCRELLRESGTDRDVAIAFLHGYILGKAGTTTLDVAGLRRQSAAFIDRCIDNPKATALETMRGTEGAR